MRFLSAGKVSSRRNCPDRRSGGTVPNRLPATPWCGRERRASGAAVGRRPSCQSRFRKRSLGFSPVCGLCRRRFRCASRLLQGVAPGPIGSQRSPARRSGDLLGGGHRRNAGHAGTEPWRAGQPPDIACHQGRPTARHQSIGGSEWFPVARIAPAITVVRPTFIICKD